MDPIEMYVLGLGVLNHEPDTHKILADVLEEQGELGMAQWARSKKSSRVKRLDFVLAILPTRLALGVACSFAARALELFPKDRIHYSHQYTQSLQSKITVMVQVVSSTRRLATEHGNNDVIVAPLSAWARNAYSVSTMEETEVVLALHTAVMHQFKLDEYREAGDYHGERIQVTGCRNEIRKVCKLARQLVRKYEGLIFRRAVDRQHALAEYPNWQFEYLKNFLTELIDKPVEGAAMPVDNVEPQA